MAERKFDIIVWGATGYTGTLVCEYLTKNAPDLKWAIGGRSKEKLVRLKAELTKIKSVIDVAVLIGDITDQSSIDAIVKQTKVILSAAGPFSQYGTPVVDACVRLGTDYCDMTGETSWIRKMAQKYHDQARKTGAVIVNSCGFDSIPNDIAAFFVADYVKEKYGSECEELKNCMEVSGAGVSGGTIASMHNEISTTPLSAMQDPYYLVTTENKPQSAQPGDRMFLSYDNDTKLWLYPYVLAAGENKFVRRSQSLMGYRYGNFKFSVSAGSKSFLVAAFVNFFLIVVVILVQFGAFRRLLTKLMPPGSGPKRSNLPKGGFSILVSAEPKNKSSSVPARVYGRVTAEGDPGYFLTSVMISECALCLATQKDKIPGSKGGVLTPSSSMGKVLVERLQNTGFKLEIVDSPL